MAKSILGAFADVEAKRQLNKNAVELVYYTDIKPADTNRKLRNVEELAEDISEDGLEENLVIREIDNSNHKYEIIAGHHRYAAICLLIKKGHTEFEYIPCKIIKNIDDLEAKRRQHLNNIFQRGYTQAEMLDAIEDLQEIYKIKKKEEGLPGRVQTLIAEAVGLQKTQIGNYQYIIKHATPEVRELIREKEIPITTALQLCTLENEEQLMFIESGSNIDLMTIKEYKEQQASESKESCNNNNYVDDYEEHEESNKNYAEEYDQDKYDDYDEVDDNDFVQEQQNQYDEFVQNEEEKKPTLTELGNTAINSIKDMLKTMEKYTEWDYEREELQEICDSLCTFIKQSGLD